MAETRRTYRRIPVELPVSLRWRTSAGAARQIRGKTENVSGTGLFVVAPVRLRRETPISFTVILPQEVTPGHPMKPNGAKDRLVVRRVYSKWGLPAPTSLRCSHAGPRLWGGSDVALGWLCPAVPVELLARHAPADNQFEISHLLVSVAVSAWRGAGAGQSLARKGREGIPRAWCESANRSFPRRSI